MAKNIFGYNQTSTGGKKSSYSHYNNTNITVPKKITSGSYKKVDTNIIKEETEYQKDKREGNIIEEIYKQGEVKWTGSKAGEGEFYREPYIEYITKDGRVHKVKVSEAIPIKEDGYDKPIDTRKIEMIEKQSIRREKKKDEQQRKADKDYKENIRLGIEAAREKKEIYAEDTRTKQQKAYLAMKIAEGMEKGIIGSELLRAKRGYGKARNEVERIAYRNAMIKSLEERNKVLGRIMFPNSTEKRIEMYARKEALRELKEEIPREQITGYTYGDIYKDLKQRKLIKREGKNIRIRIPPIIKKEKGLDTWEKRFIRITDEYKKMGVNEEEAANLAQNKIQEEMRKYENKRMRNIAKGRIITDPKRRERYERWVNTGFGKKWKGKTLDNTYIGII